MTGGAGFIGAHLANRILDTSEHAVTVFDNFSTGRRWHFGARINDPRLTITEGDCRNQEQIAEVIHRLRGIVPTAACIDTCHTHVAGYDLVSEAGFHATLEQLDATIGLRHVPVWHCNDAKAARGSRPGFLSSSRMSRKVGRPTDSVT